MCNQNFENALKQFSDIDPHCVTYDNDYPSGGQKKSPLFLPQTRMTTFIKTKFKKWDDQTNIDQYRVAANITI